MKKKGIINNFLYGKGNDNDFTNSMLPPTRTKQFFYILKRNWFKLFCLNLLLFVFFLPALTYNFIMTIYISERIKGIEQSQYINQLLSITTFQYLPLIFLLMTGFVGISGVSFIIRKMLFDEVVDIKTDFIKGVKYSWKQHLFLGFLLGLFIFIHSYASQYVLLCGLEPFLTIFIYVLIWIIFALLIISIMYMSNLSTLYVMNNFMLVKSGLVLTIKELPRNVLVFILGFIPIFIWMAFSYLYLRIITPILLIIFGFSYILLIFTELSMFGFDKYINQKSYLDFYKKGLRNG